MKSKVSYTTKMKAKGQLKLDKAKAAKIAAEGKAAHLQAKKALSIEKAKQAGRTARATAIASAASSAAKSMMTSNASNQLDKWNSIINSSKQEPDTNEGTTSNSTESTTKYDGAR